MVYTVLESAFTELSKSESIIRDFKDLKKGYIEKWEFNTEIQVNSFLVEVSFYMYFKESFPLSIPKIYVTEDSYNKLKYIPHLDSDRSICIFEEDTLILDPDNPKGIILICLRRIKKIIQEGLEGSNSDDFRNEIKAYWVQQYSEEPEVKILSYLNLLSIYPTETCLIKLNKLEPHYRGFSYILSDEAKVSSLFLEFFRVKGYKLKEQEALFLSDYKLEEQPPYSIKNKDLQTKISCESFPLFRKYINQSLPISKYIFFRNGEHILGWVHTAFNTKRNGFRPGTLNNWKIFTNFQKNDYVNRIYVNTYNNDRIEKRTAGIIQPKLKFLIAGLGSVGSNLIYFLNAVNYPDYKLIDEDILTIENIGRHLLGIDSINAPKTEGIKKYIKNTRPDQSVEIKTTKLETVLLHHIEFVNDNDYAFIAIGNQNIENYLLKLINTGEITVPVFILWVEPYLLGGHCLYIHPENKITENCIFENYIYLFNVISSSEYRANNPLLSKNEAGCQTSYSPYSQNDLVLFLSEIYKEINSIIKRTSKESVVIRWTGNTLIADELNISLNRNIGKSYSYQITKL
ncbi:E2/UBC family protein [Dysgonomonas sp. BGC7]|uniref:E2/UBC family protein n=1 Tax=Dysgonomonas sp. BGC7 TaxID=1658008 RepID=UPI000681182D|nr:E2/UBC family protein [Dysgonomonas sp. BGC7]